MSSSSVIRRDKFLFECWSLEISDNNIFFRQWETEELESMDDVKRVAREYLKIHMISFSDYEFPPTLDHFWKVIRKRLANDDIGFLGKQPLIRCRFFDPLSEKRRWEEIELNCMYRNLLPEFAK
jgi:hypothetical protein